MKAVWFWYCNEAFGTVSKQVHIKVDSQPELFRVFGEGLDREVRVVIKDTKQPKIFGNKRKQILALVDQCENDGLGNGQRI